MSNGKIEEMAVTKLLDKKFSRGSWDLDIIKGLAREYKGKDLITAVASSMRIHNNMAEAVIKRLKGEKLID